MNWVFCKKVVTLHGLCSSYLPLYFQHQIIFFKMLVRSICSSVPIDLSGHCLLFWRYSVSYVTFCVTYGMVFSKCVY